MLIRPFASADQAAARALILEGLREHFGQVDESFNSDLDDIVTSYVAPGHIFLIAETNGELVGTGALRLDDNVGQIVRLSVSQRFRRRGIGAALVATLLNAAQARRLSSVWMETNDDWHEAIRLYSQCGFRAYDRKDGCVFMELDLPRNQISSGA